MGLDAEFGNALLQSFLGTSQLPQRLQQNRERAYALEDEKRRYDLQKQRELEESLKKRKINKGLMHALGVPEALQAQAVDDSLYEDDRYVNQAIQKKQQADQQAQERLQYEQLMQDQTLPEELRQSIKLQQTLGNQTDDITRAYQIMQLMPQRQQELESRVNKNNQMTGYYDARTNQVNALTPTQIAMNQARAKATQQQGQAAIIRANKPSGKGGGGRKGRSKSTQSTPQSSPQMSQTELLQQLKAIRDS